MTDQSQEVIVVPGPEGRLVKRFNQLHELQRVAIEVKRDKYIQDVIYYFRNNQLLNGLSLAEFYNRFDEFERPEHTYLKQALQQLMELHEAQFNAARGVVEEAINLHGDRSKISNPSCVYWGAGIDKFAVGFNRGWWKYVGVYDPNQLSFVPKDWPILDENDETAHLHVIGKPLVVNYDVTIDTLPWSLPKDSVDVSFFKTIGSILIQDPQISKRFWQKIVDTTKIGGLIITTDPIPNSLAYHFEANDDLLSTIGTSVIDINAPAAFNVLMDGYVPKRFEFYTLKVK